MSKRGEYYSTCDWCGSLESNASVVEIGTGLLCRKDALLLGSVDRQGLNAKMDSSYEYTIENVLIYFQMILDHLPYPHKDGYTFRPLRFEMQTSGCTSPTSMSPSYRDNDGKLQWGKEYPFFDTSAKAVEYIKSWGFSGEVMRYKITKDLIHPKKLILTGGTNGNGEPNGWWTENIPWLTAGVTDVVQALEADSPHGAFISIMSAFSDNPPVIHNTNTGNQIQLPKRGLTEEDWAYIERDETED